MAAFQGYSFRGAYKEIVPFSDELARETFRKVRELLVGASGTVIVARSRRD